MNIPFVPSIKRFKKHRRRVKSGVELRRVNVINYDYGIVALNNGKIFSNHIEMVRKTINNYFKRNTKVSIRCFPNRSYTTKPFDVRRGRGKGTVEKWYYYARTNKVLFEFKCNIHSESENLVRILNSKFPIKIALKKKENN